MKDETCLFCKIVSAEVPSEKIFETENSYAFLDIFPITEGMTLVIPKIHVKSWYELDDETLGKLMIDAKKVAELLRKTFPDKRIGVHIEGLDVDHVHVKVFPFTTPNEFRSWPDKTGEPDFAAFKKIAAQITHEE